MCKSEDHCKVLYDLHVNHEQGELKAMTCCTRQLAMTIIRATMLEQFIAMLFLVENRKSSRGLEKKNRRLFCFCWTIG